MGKTLTQKDIDIALGDLDNGGLLTPEQSDTFIRKIQDQPTILKEARVFPMNSPKADIPKIGFDSMILRPATQTAGSRALGTGDEGRAKPTTTKIELSTSEVIAEIRIPYEVLEDNVERGGLENTILDLMAERVSLDLENLIINGDDASSPAAGESLLAMTDGVLKKITSNVVDAGGASVNSGIFNDMLKGIEAKYLRNKAAMRIYTPTDVEQDYRLAVSNRGTGLGDAILTGTQALPVFGVPMKGIALMPNSNMILTNPKNIIFGVQRKIRIEQERLISEREIKIVLTARIAIELEEEEATVKVTNLG